MICLDNTDVIEGGAATDAVIEYTMHGLVGSTFTQLAAGVMNTTLTTALYTAGAAVSVVSIILVNTHSAAVAVTLKLDPADGGNPRYLIPKAISLGIGYSLHTDGVRITVMTASGAILQSSSLEAHKDTHDPEDGSDPLDAAAPAELAGVQAAAEGTSHSLARADHAHQIQHGIADNHIVTIDHDVPVDNDYAKFTADGLEGREYSEVMTDLAGQALDMEDALLTRPKIKDYGESVVAIGSDTTPELDLEDGNVFTDTIDTGETTFTFSNPPASGTAGSFTLILTNGGSQTVNWPASVDWAGGTAPTLTTSGIDILVFMTIDAGTIWYGFESGLDMS